MSCAIDPISMERQWHKRVCAIDEMRLKEKVNGARRAYDHFPNGASMAPMPSFPPRWFWVKLAFSSGSSSHDEEDILRVYFASLRDRKCPRRRCL
jgi:hypothetical protein